MKNEGTELDATGTEMLRVRMHYKCVLSGVVAWFSYLEDCQPSVYWVCRYSLTYPYNQKRGPWSGFFAIYAHHSIPRGH